MNEQLITRIDRMLYEWQQMYSDYRALTSEKKPDIASFTDKIEEKNPILEWARKKGWQW